MADTIAAFDDLMKAARANPIASIDKIQNQATKYRRYLTRLMMEGLDKKKMLQGGKEIVDYIQLSMTSTFLEYEPTQDFNWTGTNSLVELKIPWKFSLAHATWFDHEILLSPDDPVVTFKRVKNAKMQELETSLWEGKEDQLFRTPDVVQMEGHNTTGKSPYSLRCFITEDGLAPSSTNGGVTGANWTTVMTVNTTTYPNWRNQVETYSLAGGITVTLPRALDLMWDDVQYESPTNSQEFFQDTRLNKTTILTNRDGYQIVMDITRNMNDRTFSKESDFGMLNGAVTYHGLPIRRIGAFENSALFSTVYPAGQPRFWFVNFNDIYPIYHKAKFMQNLDIPGANSKPQAHVVARDTWSNNWCHNRRHQGIVVPTT